MKIIYKYIITDTGAVLFNEQATHLMMGSGTLKCKRPIYSAGFVAITFDKKIIVEPYGESESLKIKSVPAIDKIVIEDLFNPISAIKYALMIVKDLYELQPNKYRLFIENDSELDKGRMRTLSRSMEIDFLKVDYFNNVIVDAVSKGQDVWEEIKKADEIYMDSSFIDSSGVMFNNFMYKAIEEGIKNKSVFVFRTMDNAYWGNLREELVKKCFSKKLGNNLYVIQQKEVGNDEWQLVNIEKLLEEKFY